MDEDQMWKDFYHKIVAEQEKKRQDGPQERSDHEARVQEEDGGFFEKIGVLLVDKSKNQQIEENLPSTTTTFDQKSNDNIAEVDDDDDDDDKKEATEEYVQVKKREIEYAARESELNQGQTIAETVESTDSENEEHDTNYGVVAQSVGLNVEELYTALLYMTQHQIGFDVADEISQDAIISYLQKAFNIDDGTHERVIEETRQMEPPEMHLNVEVMEAKELVPLDSNGKSDPFCVLYLESSPTRRYNTAVKPETLTPVWHEHFEMPLDNPENDVLNLEIWDFDPAESVPEKMSKVKNVKGMRGLVKLAKEIAITATSGNHDNELIGSTRIPLQDIPVTGHVMWYPLEKKNKAKRRGNVKLRLAFSTEHNALVAFQEHRHLLRILLLHELENRTVQEQFGWHGNWSAAGAVVVLQHGVQRGVRPEHLSLARWIEFASAHQEHQLSFVVFNKLADELIGGMATKNNCCPFAEAEIRLFWEACVKILHSAFNALRKIRRLQVDKANVMEQLVAILRLTSALSSPTLEVPSSVNLFPRKMYTWFPPDVMENENVSIAEVMEFAVIRGGAEWFEYIVANNNLENDTDESALRYHIKIIQLVRLDLQRAYELYEKLFIKTINFPYTKTLYMTYEKRVGDLCMVIVEDICGRLKRIVVESSDDPELNLGTTLFELYLAVQRFAAAGQNFCPDEEMRISRYYEWFGDGVAHWLEIAVYKAIKRIEKAVEYDNLRPVDSSVQYSSSAVDTLSIFYQIKVFWTQLAWPDAEGSYAFIAKIIDDICKSCITYVDRMSDKAESIQRKEDESNPGNVYGRQFNVSVAWCYAINNIDYVRTSIEPLAKDLGLDGVIEALAENRSQHEAERCNQTLRLIIDNAKDTMKNRIVEMLEIVARKMVPAMNRYLMEGAELSGAASNSMDKLMDYLDQNLTVLHDNLNDDNFQRILMIIWELMAAVLFQLVESNLERRRPPAYYSSLYKTLHALIQFFNLGTNELPNVKRLESIDNTLKLNGMDTNELIHRYYLDRLKEQTLIDNEPYGMLTVKAYLFNELLLNVLVLNARNLRSTDGNCNSYVKIQVYPEDILAPVKAHKTSVQKETQFPLYDESFSIVLTQDQKNLKNTIIRFEVKDKDFLRTKFMAECFILLSDIQETESHQGFGELEQIHLKLSRPTSQSSEVINVLSRRKGDSMASSFVSGIQSKINSS